MQKSSLESIFSYLITSEKLDSSLLDLAYVISRKGTSTTRAECLEILKDHNLKTLKDHKSSSLKLILCFVKVALKDNLISEEEIKSIRFLKLLLDINEGDFMKDKSLSNEVSEIIIKQIDLMYADDNKIDNQEALQKVNLQEIFGLSFDEFITLSSTADLNAIDKGADWSEIDSFITSKEYDKWWKEHKHDPELDKEIAEIRRAMKNKTFPFNDDNLDEERSRHISQDVKDKVWNRDGGVCVECDSNDSLEFDHIIPFSKGGANTYRNIQLLCEKCNREKSAKIG
jgi:hypothetical protein